MERTEAPAAARDGQGRWAPGQSGNPAGKKPGTRNHTSLLHEALRDGEDAAVARVIVEKAIGGHFGAARFVADRLAPRPPGRLIGPELPARAGGAGAIAAIVGRGGAARVPAGGGRGGGGGAERGGGLGGGEGGGARGAQTPTPRPAPLRRQRGEGVRSRRRRRSWNRAPFGCPAAERAGRGCPGAPPGCGRDAAESFFCRADSAFPQINPQKDAFHFVRP